MAKKIEQTTPVFDKETLIAAAPAFGTTPEVMVGALCAIKGPITLDQAREKVKAFLDRPVKNQ